MASPQDTVDAAPLGGDRPATPNETLLASLRPVEPWTSSEPITVEQARNVLAAAGSPAADLDAYAATRGATGWLFRPDSDTAPLGAFAWVVSDRGRPRGVPAGTAAEDILARISKEPVVG